MWLGKVVLQRYGYDVGLLGVVLPLLIAFSFIRIASYILGHVIAGPVDRVTVERLDAPEVRIAGVE